MFGFLELTDTIYHKSLSKSIQLGALTAFILSSLFILLMRILAGEWILIPIATATLGGAIGGVIFHIIFLKWDSSGWQRILLTAVVIGSFLIIFWICLALGFAITGHWD